MDKVGDKWEKQNKSWDDRYETIAQEVGVDKELIKKSREKLVEYFGEDWLKQELAKLKTYSPNNPLGAVGLITNPMASNGVEVIELAKYLRSVEVQENFQEIITKLKNASDYKAIRLNLAIGYRLKNSGWEEVTVEPNIGDVKGKLFGKQYVVECSLIAPPNLPGKYAHEVYRSVYKYLKKNKYPVWIHVKFNKDFKEIPVGGVISAVAELNHRFVQKQETIETQTEEFSMTATLLDERVKYVLAKDREKEEGDSLVDISYRISRAQPKRPGDIHSLDPDDPNQIDEGTISFGGTRQYYDSKTTGGRLLEKIKAKKKQTAGVPSNTRRLFVFMTNGKVEQEDWSQLAGTIISGLSTGDSVDGILFMDRRHQEFDGKLRFPSGQVYFFTKPYRLKALEKSFEAAKAFEESDWISVDDIN